MNIANFNGLNVVIDSRLELILALHVVQFAKSPELREELDFIECPPIPYIEELISLINSVEHESLTEFIMDFSEESIPINIALWLDEKFDLVENKIDYKYLNRYFGRTSLEVFAKLLKEFADAIKWSEFWKGHLHFYENLGRSFCDFPTDLNLIDLQEFYGVQAGSYNYLPSILMNGGFGVKDGEGKCYYVRGIQYDEKDGRFSYDASYLLECMFHEFSHPIVNPLIDKTIGKFQNLEKIQEEAISNGLPKTYSTDKRTILYEYLVRANAYILTLKYFPHAEISDWIITHGFLHLPSLIEFTLKERGKYGTYAEFFDKALIEFIDCGFSVEKRL